MEKDTREAIRSVVGSLPNRSIKAGVRTSFAEFCCGHDVGALLPTGLVVKEPVPSHDIRHDQTLCDWLRQIQSGTGQIQSF